MPAGINLGPSGPALSQAVKDQIRAAIGAIGGEDEVFPNRSRTAAEGIPDNTEFATGILTFAGLPTQGNVVVIGDITYTFVAVANNAYEVAIQGTIADTISELATSINSGDANGGVAHPDVTAVASSPDLDITAAAVGSEYNTKATTTNDGNLSWAAATLTGGVSAITGDWVAQICRVGDAAPYDWWIWDGDDWARNLMLGGNNSVDGFQTALNGSNGKELKLFDDVLGTYHTIRLSNGALIVE